MLTFKQLATANLNRNNKGFNHKLSEWSIAEWTNAVAGEAGEAANIAKKLIRFRSLEGGVAMLNNKGKSYEELVNNLGFELADVVIYCDLTAQAAGVSLEKYVRDGFNNKSIEMNFGERFKL